MSSPILFFRGRASSPGQEERLRDSGMVYHRAVATGFASRFRRLLGLKELVGEDVIGTKYYRRAHSLDSGHLSATYGITRLTRSTTIQ